MRCAIIALCLAVLVAVVSSEMCTKPTDCMNLACTGMEECEMGMCTCEAGHDLTCTDRADCAHLHMHGHCQADNVHCVDGMCRCKH